MTVTDPPCTVATSLGGAIRDQIQPTPIPSKEMNDRTLIAGSRSALITTRALDRRHAYGTSCGTVASAAPGTGSSDTTRPYRPAPSSGTAEVAVSAAAGGPARGSHLDDHPAGALRAEPGRLKESPP